MPGLSTQSSPEVTVPTPGTLGNLGGFAGSDPFPPFLAACVVYTAILTDDLGGHEPAQSVTWSEYTPAFYFGVWGDAGNQPAQVELVSGTFSSPAPLGCGVLGSSSNGSGVIGITSETSAAGVYGAGRVGVAGFSDANPKPGNPNLPESPPGGAAGVYGHGSGGAGVIGTSDTGNGVFGQGTTGVSGVPGRTG